MSRTARSIQVASIYLIGLGIGLIFIPNLVLSAFNLPPTNEVWIHMLGMITMFLGFSQLQAAQAELRSYFRATVIMRYSVVVFIIGFIVIGLAKPIFLSIALVDILGATWTLWELNRSDLKVT